MGGGVFTDGAGVGCGRTARTSTRPMETWMGGGPSGAGGAGGASSFLGRRVGAGGRAGRRGSKG